jgi:hypothetical protein
MARGRTPVGATAVAFKKKINGDDCMSIPLFA